MEPKFVFITELFIACLILEFVNVEVMPAVAGFTFRTAGPTVVIFAFRITRAMTMAELELKFDPVLAAVKIEQLVYFKFKFIVIFDKGFVA